MHMNKSAGSTIKAMLKKYKADEGLSLGLYTGAQYLQGPEGPKKFLDEQHDLIAGGFAEGLRSSHPSRDPEWAVDDCKWFTVFRQ